MDKDKQIQRVPKYSVEEFQDDPKGLIKRGLKDMGITDSILIPYENLGFDDFIYNYLFELSHTERTRAILSIYPKHFWDNLGIEFVQALEYADYLCSPGALLGITLLEKKDEWLTLNAVKIAHALKTTTARDGELNANKDFTIKAGKILYAELQYRGFYMLTLLPTEEQKHFLENARQSLAPEHALRMWAELICFPLAKQLKIIERTRFITPVLPDLVDAWGLIETISWIRNLNESNYNNFAQYIRNNALVLLGMKK